jgi:AraC-like DNA-binding protein
VLAAKLLRAVGGPGLRLRYVNLAVDARSRDVPEIEDRLACEFRCNPSRNAIAFPAAVLDRPVASSNRLLFRLLGGYLDRVRAAPRASIVERVEDYVRGALASGACSIEHCARKLDTSVRTLQANLGDHGLKFSDILERQRIELARSHLGRERLSLDEVAAQLGYAEQSSFGRAFKRWTGVTPQQYRRSAAG